MLTQIELVRFRAFPHLLVDGLARVNLIVGRNNSGKTSVLEAVEILAAGGSPLALLQGPNRRDEATWLDEEEREPAAGSPLRHVFPGHTLDAGTTLEVSGTNGGRVYSKYEVVYVSDDAPEQAQLEFSNVPDSGQDLALRCQGHRLERDVIFPLSLAAPSREWARSSRYQRLSSHRIESQLTSSGPPVQFLGTEGMTASRLAQSWDKIALSPKEDLLVRALQILNPHVDRVAIVGRESDPPPWRNAVRTAGVRLKLRGQDEPLPLGSMGEGSRRLFYIALAMTQAAGGFLLVDEIDTGLHYSALMRMWTLVTKAALELDVQVLATSHSSDCIRALAELASADKGLADLVCVQRVAVGAAETVRYGADELGIAMTHNIEVRG